MLSVPIAPAFVAITKGPVTMPLSAIVSMPMPNLAILTELLLQVEAAGHRHRTLRVCTIADFGGEAVLMMTIPPIAIVSVPGPTCRY
jgi:hypothetical protein